MIWVLFYWVLIILGDLFLMFLLLFYLIKKVINPKVLKFWNWWCLLVKMGKVLCSFCPFVRSVSIFFFIKGKTCQNQLSLDWLWWRLVTYRANCPLRAQNYTYKSPLKVWFFSLWASQFRKMRSCYTKALRV